MNTIGAEKLSVVKSQTAQANCLNKLSRNVWLNLKFKFTEQSEHLSGNIFVKNQN